MKTPSGNRTFEKLILVIGILVAIIAGLNSSPVENKQHASPEGVRTVKSADITTEITPVNILKTE